MAIPHGRRLGSTHPSKSQPRSWARTSGFSTLCINHYVTLGVHGVCIEFAMATMPPISTRGRWVPRIEFCRARALATFCAHWRSAAPNGSQLMFGPQFGSTSKPANHVVASVTFCRPACASMIEASTIRTNSVHLRKQVLINLNLVIMQDRKFGICSAFAGLLFRYCYSLGICHINRKFLFIRCFNL